MDAKTTLAQIGNATLAKINARGFVHGGDTLHFQVGSPRKLDKIVIKLNAMDTYDVSMVSINRKTYKVETVGEFDDVYADNLGLVVKSLVCGLKTERRG